MKFSEQLSKLRKATDMTQEDLAEKCDVSRQAVAKWESGESVPDIYKISQIAIIFSVTIEELVWGKSENVDEEQTAKDIYALFVENLENLRNKLLICDWLFDRDSITKLRVEIMKARMMFPQTVIDELMQLASDFGEYWPTIRDKAEYQGILTKEGYLEKEKQYCEIIIPQKYAALENLLKKYIKFP